MSAPTPTNVPPEDMPHDRSAYLTPYAPPQPQQAPPPIPPAPRKTSHTGLIVAVIAIVVLVPVMLCIGASLLAGAFGIFTASQQRVEQTATSQYQIAVPSHPVITIADTAGQVTITSANVQQVTVVATKHARAASADSARNLLSGMSVRADSTADGARITATMGASSAMSQRSVDLRITVPQTSDLSLTVNAGTISIDSVTGKISVTNNAGTVDLRNVTLQGTSTIEVNTGTLHFEGALASDAAVTATVNTGNATLRLPQESATHLDAAARVGSIHVSGWSPTIQQSGVGQSAAFDLNPQPTSTMTVHVDVGQITIGSR